MNAKILSENGIWTRITSSNVIVKGRSLYVGLNRSY